MESFFDEDTLKMFCYHCKYDFGLSNAIIQSLRRPTR